jgi:hypothetical protein
MKAMTEAEKLQHCQGCRDDFYNHGNRSTNGRCWHLPTMKLELAKEVPLDQPPPWTQKPKLVPKCYSKDGVIFFRDERKKGKL